MGAKNWSGKAQRYGPIRTMGKEYSRQALAERLANKVWHEAGARMPNLVCQQGRSSDCSGILFEKKIQRKARATITSGHFPKYLRNRNPYCK
jgi:hypothetical protein